MLIRVKIVPRESAIFGIPGDKEAIVEIKAKHSDICRFDESEHDKDLYKLVQSNVEDLYEKALKKDESDQIQSGLDESLENRLAALRNCPR